MLGSEMPPMMPTYSRSASISPARPATKPASRSLCPPRYLVAEWITRSIPHANGVTLTGVAKVASTTVNTPRRRPIAAKRSRSKIRRNGFVGVSENSTHVSGRIAASNTA